MKYFVPIQILLFIYFVPCEAALYQVGPSKPYASLQSVAPLLQPGDVVEVDGDTSYAGGVIFTQAGSPTEKITIRGIRINGQRPILSGGTNTVTFATPWPYSGPGADHYILEGFEITQGSFRGIYHQADDLLVRDVVVHNCPAHGILGADEGSGSLVLDHVEVHHCGNGGSQHQIYMATDEVNRPGSVFRMQFCYIHDGIGGNNVKSRAERNEIYYNWIEGAYYHELELIGPDGGDGGNPSLKREDSDVVGNVLWKRNAFYTIRVGGDGTGETNGRYRFVNNTIIAGTSAVFRIFDGIESIEMHNNVIFMSGGANITRTVEAVWSTGSELIAGTSNWVSTGSINIPVQWGDTAIGIDPGFIDFANSDPRPTSGSPLIDTGATTLDGPEDYPFPAPLMLPHEHPPLHEPGTLNGNEQRPVDDRLDRGAFEGGVFWCVDRNNTTGIELGSFIYPFSTIQAGLDVADSGESVLVARGTYNQNAVISNKSVKLLGSYLGAISVDYAAGIGGDFSIRGHDVGETAVRGVNTAAVILVVYSGSSGSVIDGLHLSGGRHGILLDDDLTWPLLDSITMSNNTIESNGVTDNYGHIGGGISVSGSSMNIGNNIIRNNTAGRGAGIGGNCLNLVLENNVIEENVGYGDHGGGIYLAGSASITGNIIRGNRTGENIGYGWGGGILILEEALLSFNQIYSNYAPSIGGGVFIDETGVVTMANELIYGNTTSAHDKGGAGIYVDGGYGTSSFAQIANCTVADNSSPGSTGGNGVYIEGNSTVLVKDSIFWENDGDDFYVQSGSDLTVTYSTTFESIGGTGNSTANPLFSDPINHDYHLRSVAGRWDQNALCGQGTWNVDVEHSPAIDRGDPGSDYHQEPQPHGNRVNAGAFGNTVQASRSLALGSGPVAGFSADIVSGTAPLSVNFTDLSVNLPQSWNWDFDGDCIFDSTMQNPTRTYEVPGVYSVTLVVSNSIGSDIETKALFMCVGGVFPGSVASVSMGTDKETVYWQPADLAASYDVVKGSLNALLSNEGNFTVAITDCLAQNVTGLEVYDPEIPGSSEVFFYLVRAVSCDDMPGTWDSGGSGQVGERDAEIEASVHACP